MNFVLNDSFNFMDFSYEPKKLTGFELYKEKLSMIEYDDMFIYGSILFNLISAFFLFKMRSNVLICSIHFSILLVLISITPYLNSLLFANYEKNFDREGFFINVMWVFPIMLQCISLLIVIAAEIVIKQIRKTKQNKNT